MEKYKLDLVELRDSIYNRDTNSLDYNRLRWGKFYNRLRWQFFTKTTTMTITALITKTNFFDYAHLMGPLMNSCSVLFSSLTWLVGGGSFFAMVIVMMRMKMRERQIDKNFLSIRTQAVHCHMSPEYSSILNLSYTPCLDTIFGPKNTRLPAIDSRSGRCLEVYTQILSQFFFGKYPFLCFCLVKKSPETDKIAAKLTLEGHKYIP